MTIDRVISESRECASCGYELRGLSVGGNCPECGEPIRPRRALGPREGQLTDAPRGYVRRLRLGFRLMTLHIAVGWFAFFLGVIAYMAGAQPVAWFFTGVEHLAGVLWTVGVWVITMPRPPKFAERQDAVLDGAKMRLIMRIAAVAWGLFDLMPDPEWFSGSLEVALSIAKIVIGYIAFAGMIPTCIFLADIAFWMSNDAGAWRLRASAWTMAVFGTLSVFGDLMLLVGNGFGGLLWLWSTVILIIATLVFLYSVIECTRMLSWALNYQLQTEGRQERINKRIEARMTKGDVVTSGIVCRKCGYDLDGLPFGGHCPECGLSYADATPLPVRRAPTRTDDAPIDLGDGPTEAIIHKQPSIANPRGGRSVDDSPIPLAGDDEPRPDSEIDDRLDRLSD